MGCEVVVALFFLSFKNSFVSSFRVVQVYMQEKCVALMYIYTHRIELDIVLDI